MRSSAWKGCIFLIYLRPISAGEVSEWLKEHAWKVCIPETVSRVRIPLSPHIFFNDHFLSLPETVSMVLPKASSTGVLWTFRENPSLRISFLTIIFSRYRRRVSMVLPKASSTGVLWTFRENPSLSAYLFNDPFYLVTGNGIEVLPQASSTGVLWTFRENPSLSASNYPVSNGIFHFRWFSIS